MPTNVSAIMVALILLAGLGTAGYSWSQVAQAGIWSTVLFGFAFVAGTILTPALLPWLPGRAFSTKGMWIGLGVLLLAGWLTWKLHGMAADWIDIAAWWFQRQRTSLQ